MAHHKSHIGKKKRGLNANLGLGTIQLNHQPAVTIPGSNRTGMESNNLQTPAALNARDHELEEDMRTRLNMLQAQLIQT